MLNSILTSLSWLLFFMSPVLAVPRLELVPTPTGLMAEVGISLLPTEAPGQNGIPRELLRRAQPPYPPPVNYCGFINGKADDVLYCPLTEICVYFGSAMGCCQSGLFATCTQVYTACSAYTDSCGTNCFLNNNILKCSNSLKPYCGTYKFDGGTSLLNCESTPSLTSSVEFLMDFYISSLGSLIASVGPIYITNTAQRLTVTAAPATVTAPAPSRSVDPNVLSTPPNGLPNASPSPLSNSTPDPKPSSGLSTGAIIGIAVGAVVVVLAIVIALLVVFCMRRRDKNRRESQALTGNHGAAMQTQPLMSQNVPFDGKPYQPVSQQELKGPETPLSPPVSAYTETKSIPASSPPPSQQPPNYQPIATPMRTPVPSAPMSDTDNHMRHSEVPSAFSAPISPSMPHPNASEVYGDIYRGQTSHDTIEVDGMSRPLQSSGQMPHELEYRYHDAVYEAPGSTMFRTPSGHNLHEMQSDQRYAQ